MKSDLISNIPGRTEEERIERVLAQFRDDGFSVAAKYGIADLPSWVAEARPDYIATGPDRSVGIFIRRHAELNDPRLQQFAQRTQKQPGWGFTVIVPDRVPEREEPPFPRVGPTSIDGFLRFAEEMRGRGEAEAGRVLLQIAIESAARFLAERYDVPYKDGALSALLRQLVTEGLMDRVFLKPLTQTILPDPIPVGFPWERVTEGVRELLAEARADERK